MVCCCGDRCGICCAKFWTLFWGLFENLCFAGCVYGWPSLVYVLYKDQYYGHLCNNNATLAAKNVTAEETACPEQDSHFNLVFTVAAFCVSLSTLPNGILYDKAGTRVSKICISILLLGGFILFIFSSPELPFLIYPAMILWAIGGCQLLVVNFQIANLFASKRSTIITFLSAAFDSSAITMLVIKFAYEGGISLRTIFIALAVLTLFININTFLLLPSKRIPFPLPKDYFYRNTTSPSGQQIEEIGLRPLSSAKVPNGSTHRLHNRFHNDPEEDGYGGSYSPDSGLGMTTINNNQNASNSADSPKSTTTLKQCLLSGLFFSHLIWMSIVQHRNWFYLGTFNPWINTLVRGQSISSSEADIQVSHYTTVFAFLQFGAVFVGPLNGLIIDRHKKKTLTRQGSRGSWQVQRTRGPNADLQDTVLAFLVTNTICVLFSIGVVIPILQVQYISFVLQVILKTFVYGLNAAFIATVFPVDYLGTLLGFSLALSAIFGLIQFPLFKMSQHYFDNDPFIVNVGLLVLNLVTYAHPFYITYFCKREDRLRETEEYERLCRQRDSEQLKVMNMISTV
ncbi:equilibrative nucleobase transporter 1-like [Saccoglossus kowalevskii]|uniref:Solute carrier family 43 member 3-like n=1 Tax=Saccoglossus kowalevskii TaxID=10224 RepID=A0ABM0M9X7_SACKO|nr:PREDICTED: solute carrier family 43 member 3-like [Saccoglossus kowalevskii]